MPVVLHRPGRPHMDRNAQSQLFRSHSQRPQPWGLFRQTHRRNDCGRTARLGERRKSMCAPESRRSAG